MGRDESSGTRPGSIPGQADAGPGDWVRIHDVVLPAGARAPQVPSETQQVPLEMWVNGFCGGRACIGDQVEVTTLSGRIVRGRLVQVGPACHQGFGRPVPQLLAIGPGLRRRLGCALEPSGGGGTPDLRADAGTSAETSGGTSYAEVMTRRGCILKQATGIDYERFESGSIAFDYEGMMAQAGYDLRECAAIQREAGVGRTPLIELSSITRLARQFAPPGRGARIFIKDEACNPSGSFKARRAAVSVYHARRGGYGGVIAATSGNYGAAVASQAARRGLRCIVVQEAFDSRGVGQPEIIEKGRHCEAYGAEVIQLTVGPELFYVFLLLLERTGFFNASLYVPFGVAGIETLGWEIATDVREAAGRDPDAVVATHAGGGNVTGTARGLVKAGCSATRVIAASVDLTGLHMASDRDFNRKSFTTGHTGFGIPFATWPDRADVPRNAARSLRYMDRYCLVTQGEVFYATEMLAQLEGLERGPAGNISLAAAFAVAQEMERDQVVVVQETEYTGAGKHPTAQLTFAVDNGVEVTTGDPRDNVPGRRIVIPRSPNEMRVRDVDLAGLRASYIRHALDAAGTLDPTEADVEFLAADSRSDPDFVRRIVQQVRLERSG